MWSCASGTCDHELVAYAKNLDMPGMTMVFTVRDKGQLAKFKPGDKVKFMVVQEGGKMIVTDIQPAS